MQFRFLFSWFLPVEEMFPSSIKFQRVLPSLTESVLTLVGDAGDDGDAGRHTGSEGAGALLLRSGRRGRPDDPVRAVPVLAARNLSRHRHGTGRARPLRLPLLPLPLPRAALAALHPRPGLAQQGKNKKPPHTLFNSFTFYSSTNLTYLDWGF